MNTRTPAARSRQDGFAIVDAALFCAVLAAGGVTLLGGARAAADSGTFPVTVRVSSSHTYLRAGPGDDFYPTERLVAGTSLEVWATDPAGSGYVAVRPVAGSFSWLRACDVDADGATPAAAAAVAGGTAVVVTNGAVSRVGSQLNDLRHVAQVTLEAGERVQVLEKIQLASGRHAGSWVRIEPPAGEFRWVRWGDVEPPAGLFVVAPPAPAEDAAGAAALGEAVVAIKQAGVALAQAVGEGDAPRGVPPPATPAAPSVAPPQELGFMPAARRLFTGWLPRGSAVFDPVTPITPVAVAGAGASPSGDELADIELALSLAVTGPAEAWNLAPVRERLRQVAARAANDADRGRIAALDARIAKFEGIQSRHRALEEPATAPGAAPLQIGGMWSSLSGIGTRPIRPGVMPGGASADGQTTWTPPAVTETTGRLATVVSRRPDAPRWAIVDPSNNVIAFVTPQTGVNLAPLVGQDVTVRGARGYMPEYNRPYLVAAEARTRMAAAPEASPDRAVR